MARYFDGTFTTPVADGPKRFYAPFLSEGDTTTRAFKQEYLQRMDSWTPATFMETEIVDGFVFYMVEETPTQHIGAGMVRFVREYAMLPIARTTPRQMSFTFRGLSSDQTYPQVVINSNSLSGGTHTFICAANPSVSVGDRVLIRAIQTQYSAGIQTNFMTRRTAAAGTSGTTVVVDLPVLPPPGNNTLTYTFLQKVEDGRDPRTNAVTAFVEYAYFIPNVSPQIKKVTDIPIKEPELIIDATGKETMTYTDTTVPDRASYLSKVAGGEKIVAEHTRIVRWKGDIFEASTPFVIAE